MINKNTPKKEFDKTFVFLLIIIYEKNVYKLRGLFKGPVKLDKEENIF